MEPDKFPQANKDLLKPEGWTDDQCNSLPVFSDGTQCISLWKMTWRERFSALLFGKVWLSVYSGHTQPPVWLEARREIFQGSETMNWTAIAADMRKIRAENEENLEIRRGDTTVDAQAMRIESAGTRGFRLQSDAARVAQHAVIILGEPDMDIAVDDRLTYTDILLKVVFIQPNRLACTIAEAIAVE